MNSSGFETSVPGAPHELDAVAYEGCEYAEEARHPLDGPKTGARMSRVLSWWQDARDKQHEARMEAMKDHDFYDGDQWPDEAKQVLKERGQAAFVFNMIKPAIDWIAGTQRRSKYDFHVLPRTEDDGKEAQVKQKLFKFVSDVCHVDMQVTKAFEDAIISGLGWLELGKRHDPDDDPLYVAYEDWRYMWYDPNSKRDDLSDGRFVIRGKWLDLDVAQAMFPDRKIELEQSATTSEVGTGYGIDDLVEEDEMVSSSTGPWGGGSTEAERKRVFIIECWYREPVKRPVMRGSALGVFSGIAFDELDADHVALRDEGWVDVYDSVQMKVRCLVFCGDVALQDMESPYIHNEFPFVPVYAYQSKRTRNFYGVVRNLRDPQNDLNKRRSKALHVLNTNQKIIRAGAVTDFQHAVDELDKPDGALEVNGDVNDAIRVDKDKSIAQYHIDYARDDHAYIESASGVTDENLGRETNATSGKAVRARQEQGSTVTAPLYDNLSHSRRLLGERLLSLIEQYYSDEKVVRVTDSRQRPEFVVVNQIDPDTGEYVNDITRSKADFIISDVDWSASVRQAQAEQLMDLLPQLGPEIATALLDLVVDAMDIPGKEELVRRIRDINGMPDPDATPDDQDAVEQDIANEQKQAQQEAEQKLAEIEMQIQDANLSKIKADADLAKEKAQTERVKQEQIFSGMESDKEKLTIERAEALAKIEASERGQAESSDVGREGTSLPSRGRKGHDERGLKSNNTE